jgi:AcrR family transcriptional regulator
MKLPDARHYRQSVRAQAAAETHRRIVEAFREAVVQRWFDEVRLEDVARGAGVTVQTVIRRFGGKEGLIAAMVDMLGADVQERRAIEPGNLDAAVVVLMEDYEAVGDFLWRILAQEDRFPALTVALDIGRAGHRDWLSRIFAPFLDRFTGAARATALDALVAATDLYVWKLLRRDLGLTAEATAGAMRRLIDGALGARS